MILLLLPLLVRTQVIRMVVLLTVRHFMLGKVTQRLIAYVRTTKAMNGLRVVYCQLSAMYGVEVTVLMVM